MANEENNDGPSVLEKKIIKQLEYYFGDMNLARDKFLQEKIKEDEGWVSLEVMVTFNRLKILSEDFEVLMSAMKKSTSGLIEVNEEGKKIRRSPDKPMPEQTKERKDDLKVRSLYVKGFPVDQTLDTLIEFFEKAGTTEQVKMRKDIDGKFKGSCFVVYNSVESAKKFLNEADHAKYEESDLIRMLKDDYFKKKLDEKKQDREEELKKKEAAKVQRQAEENEEFGKRITKGAILKFGGIVEDTVDREEIKAFFAQHGKVAWADFDKGDKEGTLRFDGENSASEALEKAKAAGEGKVLLREAALECSVLDGEEELDHWRNIFRTRKDARDKKRSQGDKQRRKGNFKRPMWKRGSNDDSGRPAKQAKLE